MGANFDNLIFLQKLDEEITNLSLFLESIPSKKKELDEKVQEASNIVKDAKNRLTQNQKKRRDLEGNVQDDKTLITKYKSQLNTVRTNKEYSSLLKEIEDTEKKIEEIEEEIISEMLSADDIEEEIKKAAEKAKEIEKKFAEEKDVLDLKKKEAEAKKDQLLKEKEDLLPSIPKDQLSLYKEIFNKNNGTALSKVTDDFCSMCHMRIRPQMLNEIIAETQVLICENCGRILYKRNEKK